ncbi:MAG: redoxin domain-containing protein [Anaerolineales bacterium]|nr:redoxin domain-containing protein [Anaerolineales bacterium]
MTQLCHDHEQFIRLHTRVVIVSFGTLPAVQQWLNEACHNFEVLLDRERTVYQAYGLEQSFWRSRNLRTLWTYARMQLKGWRSPGSGGDDTTQLGGNFLIDSRGILRMAYRSYDPTDRPSVAYLLKEIQKLK